MELTVNGESVHLVDVKTVGDLLNHFGVSHQTIAVVANGTIVARDAFEHYAIHPKDAIDIIRFVGGG